MWVGPSFRGGGGVGNWALRPRGSELVRQSGSGALVQSDNEANSGDAKKKRCMKM
jgi:hypothetical protein